MSSEYQQQYNRWRHMHRGKRRGRQGPVFKVRHWFRLGAWWHAWDFGRRTGRSDLNVYACRWHDDFRRGESARRHWHVGSTRNAP